MAVLKSTQTRFVGITYHIHYTSLCLYVCFLSSYMWGVGNATINADYPWISPTCIESRRSITKDSTNILNQRYPISGASLCGGQVYAIIEKSSVGMYSGCDKLSLQILFVYFLALPTLLQSFNFIQLFFTLVLYYIQRKCSDNHFSSTMVVTF